MPNFWRRLWVAATQSGLTVCPVPFGSWDQKLQQQQNPCLGEMFQCARRVFDLLFALPTEQTNSWCDERRGETTKSNDESTPIEWHLPTNFQEVDFANSTSISRRITWDNLPSQSPRVCKISCRMFSCETPFQMTAGPTLLGI